MKRKGIFSLVFFCISLFFACASVPRYSRSELDRSAPKGYVIGIVKGVRPANSEFAPGDKLLFVDTLYDDVNYSVVRIPTHQIDLNFYGKHISVDGRWYKTTKFKFLLTTNIHCQVPGKPYQHNPRACKD